MPKHCDNCEMLREYLDGAEEEVVELKEKLKNLNKLLKDFYKDNYAEELNVDRLDEDDLRCCVEETNDSMKSYLKDINAILGSSIGASKE